MLSPRSSIRAICCARAVSWRSPNRSCRKMPHRPWRERSRVISFGGRRMQHGERSSKARRGVAQDKNLLALGDAVDVCTALPANLRFDLVYLDPPFGVGTTMTARVGRGQARGRRQPASGPDAYEDRAGSDAL